ncbi:NAD(P)/FAD-dependent oxidoreductase [Nocardia nova]|uniref:NAD(P)/FAD-dependent oxidoreductase n=1 Tax=Nocardia nova TaxID=37330 RepID=A0A2S6AKU0_9NOCA|nr:NAD(P)/FAD-dependent oxidoreductase [Nocardia nova]PPJ35836.1 NAD(P)/FAD-dependent oxidoreductase [Nocardia nova]
MTFRGQHEIVIVGAAFSGIGMAALLKRHCLNNFVLLEKEDAVGGVWRDNAYPGCSCDVPQQLYSYSFRPAYGPAVRYPGQRDILEYLHGVVEREGLRPHLQLSAAVVDAVYDENGWWDLTTSDGDQYRARQVIWAVGQLHRPYIPDIPGQDSFYGNMFHSARWDHNLDLADLTVAVVGTGASAIQLVPEIAEKARKVVVFQRTPHWVLPRPPEQFGSLRRWAFSHCGPLRTGYRGLVFIGADVALTPVMTRGWTARPATWLAKRHLRRHIRDPGLRSRLTPDYPIGAKRILLSNRWYSALSRDNVDLVTAPIQQVTSDGIDTDSAHHRADVIVWSTGFRATEFLVPARVRGREGVDLHQMWSDGAYAYLGAALPRFPNMYMIAGPGSFISHGSNPFIHECQSRLILAAIDMRERTGCAAVEIDEKVMLAYRRWFDAALSRTVWNEVPSWYRTPIGRIVTTWPSSSACFARLARKAPEMAFGPSPIGSVRTVDSLETIDESGRSGQGSSKRTTSQRVQALRTGTELD